MKIGFYSPYWDTLGGGEKYMFDIARCFENEELIFLCAKESWYKKAKEKFIVPQNVSFIPDCKNAKGRLKKDLLKILDIFFYQCDGSLFFSPAKKNILLIQSPAHSPKFGILNRMKLLSWKKIICNSCFTADFVSKNFRVSSVVLYPCIDKIIPSQKENIILSVGRFFPYLHSKKQEALIFSFRLLQQTVKESKNWKLILAGSVLPSDKTYLEMLEELSKGLNIEFRINISKQEIDKLLGAAKIFWHAAGFGEDTKVHPEKAEHFGISTVEAISANCYPLVYQAGGQEEIIGRNADFYWKTQEELVNKTKQIIQNYKFKKQDLDKLKNISEKYSFENFKTRLYEIIK